MSKRKERQREAGTATAPAHWRAWLPAAVIAGACLVAMGPVLSADFTSWDDYATLAHNPRFRPVTWETPAHYWAHPHMDLWVPVTYTVWAAVGVVSQSTTGALSGPLFHGANLILHAVAALVVFAFLRRVLRGDRGDEARPAAADGAARGALHFPALVGALVFAVHPVQVEAVGWASGLKDVLCGLLIWTAVWQWIRAGDVTGRAAWARYAGATLALVAGLLAKPTAMVTPLLVVVIDRMVLRRPFRQTLARVAPWVALSVACAVVARRVQPAHEAVFRPDLWLRPLVASDALAFYLWKLVAPVGLAIDHGRRPDVVLAPGGAAYWTWVVPLAVAAVAVWHTRRARRRHGGSPPDAVHPGTLVVAGSLIALVCVGPVLGLVPFDFQQYSTTAEHYLYPAMGGVALAVAALFARPRRAGWAAPVAGVVLLAYAVLSHVQARQWRDGTTLFTHAVAVNPRSYAGHNSLAAALTQAGDLAGADRHARFAIELMPGNGQAYVTLSSVRIRQGRLADAADLLRRAAALAPRDAFIRGSLVGVLAQLGDMPGALEQARAALAIDPDDAQAHLNLGTLYAQTGRPAEALAETRAAVRLAPHSFLARTNLGWMLLEQGDVAAAAEQFEAALRVDPSFAKAREGLDAARAAARGNR